MENLYNLIMHANFTWILNKYIDEVELENDIYGSSSESLLSDYLKDNLPNSSEFINYNNITLPLQTKNKISNLIYDNIISGDLILLSFNQNSNYYKVLNYCIPDFTSYPSNWTQLNYINHIYSNSTDIKNFKDYNLQISSVLPFINIIINNDINKYKYNRTIELKEIKPVLNKVENTNNICFITTDRNNIYLNLNNYKYNIFIDKINFTNFYLIYKIIDNIKYYLIFETVNNNSYYIWKKEELYGNNLLVNKLLYINPVYKLSSLPSAINITINQKHKIFNNLYYNFNKYLNNTNNICQNETIYYNIKNKKI